MASADFNQKYKIVKEIKFNMVPGGVHNHTFVENYNGVFNNGIDPGTNVALNKWTTCYMIIARGYPALD